MLVLVKNLSHNLFLAFKQALNNAVKHAAATEVRISLKPESGATGYLLKQTPREELLSSLQEVHRGGSPMSSGIARKVVQCFRKQPLKAPDNELSQLSEREEQVLDLLAQGYLYKEISTELRISRHTVDTYLRRIYEKLHVHSRAQATALYAQLRPNVLQPPGKA